MATVKEFISLFCQGASKGHSASLRIDTHVVGAHVVTRLWSYGTVIATRLQCGKHVVMALDEGRYSVTTSKQQTWLRFYANTLPTKRVPNAEMDATVQVLLDAAMEAA